jgi:hypothetical protein
VVRCTAPSTRPVAIVLLERDFRYKAARGEEVVAGERSMVQWVRWERVAVRCATALPSAAAGSVSARSACPVIAILGTVGEISRLLAGTLDKAASCSARSEGDRRSSGVGAEEVFAVEGLVELLLLKGAPHRRCVLASSAASARERALAFLLKGLAGVLVRDLNANFLGGLKEVRRVRSFSERAFMALYCGLAAFLEGRTGKDLPRCRSAGRTRGGSSMRLSPRARDGRCLRGSGRRRRCARRCWGRWWLGGPFALGALGEFISEEGCKERGRLPVTSWRKYIKKRSLDSASVWVSGCDCMAVVDIGASWRCCSRSKMYEW